MRSGQAVFPTPEERDELLKRFSRALFKRDMNALYTVVTEDFVWKFHDGGTLVRSLSNREAISNHLTSQTELFSSQRFEEVAYYHMPEITLMTCRVDEIERETGDRRTQRGVELYSFQDKKIAMKDVYRKPVLSGDHEYPSSER